MSKSRISHSTLYRTGKEDKPYLRTNSIVFTDADHYVNNLPNEKNDNQNWKLARYDNDVLPASDLAKFSYFHSKVRDIFKFSLLGAEEELNDDSIFKMELGHKMEKLVHEKLARDLQKNSLANLGSFSFQKVWLSKNRQYVFIRNGAKIGASLDAWGILNGVRTIIEIKSTSLRNFKKMKEMMALEKLTLKDWSVDSQKVFASEFPYYFYQVQAQMLSTGFSQAVIFVQNREGDSLSFLLKKDTKAIDYIKNVSRQYQKIRNYFLELKTKGILFEAVIDDYFDQFDYEKFTPPYLGIESMERQKESKKIKEKKEKLSLSEKELEKAILEYLEIQKAFREIKKIKDEEDKILKSILPKIKYDNQIGDYYVYLDGKNSISIRKISEKGA